jgi:hypothetical protein
MRSSWPAKLLPTLACLAEGAWLAVVYAAIQVATAHQPQIGPLELALLAGMGMAWARRSGWRSPLPEAAGLPLLAVLGGAMGWILDPTVRHLLVEGFPRTALTEHLPGWLAGVAVLRGASHASPDDDESVQDTLLRFGIPGLAIPWLVGSLAADAQLRAPFTAAAFLSTMIFGAAGFAALGLARLEAIHATTGSDWQRSRSWLALIGIISLATVIVGVPAGALLGVPLAAVGSLGFGLLRLVLIVAILVSTPFIVLIAAATEALRPLFPAGFASARIQLPTLDVDPVKTTSPWPTVIAIAVIAILAAVELFVLGLIVYLRWQERRRMNAVAADGFEERAIVVPPPEPSPISSRPAAPLRARRDPSDPVAAYLAALDDLARDGRWARVAAETPAAHARRVSAQGLLDPALRRLAAAYELIRYGGRRLGASEAARSRRRLARLRQLLRS